MPFLVLLNLLSIYKLKQYLCTLFRVISLKKSHSKMKNIIFLFLFLFSFSVVNAQSLDMLKGLNVDSMSDSQIGDLISKMDKKGVSINQIDQYAQSQGLSKVETAKLKNRIVRYNDKNKGVKKRSLIASDENQKNSEEELNPELLKYFNAYKQKQDSLKATKLEIFGLSIFKDVNLTFEPNLRLATPDNYVLGPDDELLIDIYGNSEATYNVFVSPEGKIKIPLVGVVSVGGLTMEEAKAVIRKRLAAIYTGIRNNSTKVSIALGDIRSITVNVIGEVAYPGTYTIPSLASVYNALYVSGGPTEQGSFRKIQISRGRSVIAVVDLYDFLVYGKQCNLRLKDQDVIKVLPYSNRVSIVGEVKVPAIFEMKEFETISNLIEFAGGFTENAYRERLTAYRNTTKEKSVIDVTMPQFNSFLTESGDEYKVGELLKRFSNRIQITGSVYRPGEYALEKGMHVSDLLKKADGLKEDAFATRAVVYRKDARNLPLMTSFSPVDVIEGKHDILLQREDSIHISSILDMREDEYVYISGEVVNPDQYPFANGMTLKDAILMANGVTHRADRSEVDVYRQVTDPKILSDELQKAVSFNFKLDKELLFNDSVANFKLKKNDRIMVRKLYGFEDVKQVKVEGEVRAPGTYVITSKNQRISDLVKMCGGFTPYAYPEGAYLIRKGKKSESEKKLLKKIAENIGTKVKKQKDDVQADSVELKKTLLSETDIVGISLKNITENPGSIYDVILEEGDVLSIPKTLETVKVSGEVMMTNTVRYVKHLSFSDYITAAGGYGNNAYKSKSYVIHANGSVEVTKKFLWFKNYPTVYPGSRIIVPEKPVKRSMSTGEIISIATSVVSVAAIITSIFK